MIKLLRLRHGERQTLGRAFLFNGLDLIFNWSTLELPRKNNRPLVSCIPAETYPVEKFISPKFGEVLLLKDVQGRSMIEMHSGNYYTDILGCILAGSDFTDINKDGFLDVVNSRNTMTKILKLIGKETVIHIID